jgi:Cysteine-rich secretory protein family
MRLAVALVVLLGCTDAQAKCPWAPAIWSSHSATCPPVRRACRGVTIYRTGHVGRAQCVRARIGLPPLVWSPQLSRVAQDWADHLIITRELRHQANNRYGENLYVISGGTSSPAQVVRLWDDEGGNYDARTNSCAGVCGHYTQVIWRATHDVGCAEATDRYRQVRVCEYDPPGNVVGYRPY